MPTQNHISTTTKWPESEPTVEIQYGARFQVLYLVDSWNPRNIALDGRPNPYTAKVMEREFDAAFAKLLWRLV